MKASVLLQKLWVNENEFVTSKELNKYCSELGLDYETYVRNFLYRGYLTRIFRGIFYVKPPEGLVLGRTKYNHLELVAKGLEMKGIKNWYFGFHTALKLNNMTHEYFTVDEVVSDSLFRPRPVGIAGYRFEFVKISPTLLKFGVRETGENVTLRYSDPEKTILDFVYRLVRKGADTDWIIGHVSEWSEDVSEDRIRMYSERYSKTVKKIVEMLIG